MNEMNNALDVEVARQHANELVRDAEKARWAREALRSGPAESGRGGATRPDAHPRPADEALEHLLAAGTAGGARSPWFRPRDGQARMADGTTGGSASPPTPHPDEE